MPSLALLGFGLVLTGVALGVLTAADPAPPRLVEVALVAESGPSAGWSGSASTAGCAQPGRPGSERPERLERPEPT